MDVNSIFDVSEYDNDLIFIDILSIMDDGEVAFKDNREHFDSLPQNSRIKLEKLLHKYSKHLMGAYLYFVMAYPQDFEEYYTTARAVVEEYENKQREEKK